MNVEIGIVAVLLLFWEYLFPIFGIGSLQCARRQVRIIELFYVNVCPFLISHRTLQEPNGWGNGLGNG